jgi:hypothetical protein
MPQAAANTDNTDVSTEQIVTDILTTIDREREREIISRRFGLFDRKETLEQIGEMLGITRERVRQLEKSVIGRLAAAAEQSSLPHVGEFETKVLEILEKSGQVARVSKLTSNMSDISTREEHARVAFISQLAPKLTLINEDD